MFGQVCWALTNEPCTLSTDGVGLDQNLLAKESLTNQISNCTNNAFACEVSLDIRLLVQVYRLKRGLVYNMMHMQNAFQTWWPMDLLVTSMNITTCYKLTSNLMSLSKQQIAYVGLWDMHRRNKQLFMHNQ